MRRPRSDTAMGLTRGKAGEGMGRLRRSTAMGLRRGKAGEGMRRLGSSPAIGLKQKYVRLNYQFFFQAF